jgi:hypothetical protein
MSHNTDWMPSTSQARIDEILSLRSQVASLRSQVETMKAALEPFAAKVSWPIGTDKEKPSFIRCEGVTPSDDGGKTFCNFALELDDFRAASQALKETP